MSGSLRRTWGQRAVLAVNAVGIATALSLAWVLDAGEEVASSVNRVELSGALTPIEEAVDGSAPPFNVLLVGYDSAANLDPDDPVSIGRQGERLGDVIIIARVDQEAGAATLLSIPRDLWVPVPGFEDQKINSAFQLGGPSLLIQTIENHLDIPINSFMSVDLAGFEGLVDVVDHVELYFEHPARDFNPAPPSGPPRSMSGFGVDAVGCQALDPANALAFVRSRNFQVNIDGEWVDDGQRSDLERIRRQQLFVESFVARSIDLGARNPLVLRELITAAVPHLTLDQELTPQGLIDIGRAFDSFDADQLESYSLPTEFGWERNRTVSVVRTVEDEALPVIRLLQGVPSSDPSTIGVTVVAANGATAEASSVSDALGDAGFEVGDFETDAEAVNGVIVAFGRDGAAAAPIVVAALAEQGLIVDGTTLDETLRGREVVVSLGPASPATTVAVPTTQAPTGAPSSTATTVTSTSGTSTTSTSTTSTSTTVAAPAVAASELDAIGADAPSPELGASVRLCP